MIHMKIQDLFSYFLWKKKWKCCLLQLWKLLSEFNLTLLLLNMTCPVLANSVDPDQLASEENWSGSALFVISIWYIIRYVNFYQNPGSSNLIGWKLEVGMAS